MLITHQSNAQAVSDKAARRRELRHLSQIKCSANQSNAQAVRNKAAQRRELIYLMS